MKKLLKSEICRSRKQYTGPTSMLKSQILRLLFTLFYCSYALVYYSCLMNSAPGTGLKKKKKKRNRTNVNAQNVT